MAWAKNGTPATLGSAGDDVDITDLSGLKFNQSMVHMPRSGNIGERRTYNNDGGSLYTHRRSANSGADSTTTSAAYTDYNVFAGFGDFFLVNYIVFISGEEKLSIEFVSSTYTAGAGTAPDRAEFVAKYVPSSLTDTLDRIDYNNAESGSYDTNSNISVIGTD